MRSEALVSVSLGVRGKVCAMCMYRTAEFMWVYGDAVPYMQGHYC
jgi:hypothetical protein